MTTTDLQTDRQHKAETILRRSVVLTLRRHLLGNVRTVDLDAVVDAATGVEHIGMLSIDKRAIGTTKRLIDPKELRGPNRVLGQVVSYLRAMAVSSHRVFGDRSYLVPCELVVTVDRELMRLQGLLREEAAALSLRYADAVARQREALGPLFRAEDYKDPAEVTESYSFDWEYVSFAAPERLETVDHALFERAKASYETRMADAYDEVRMSLRAALLETVRQLVARLQPDETGKRKAFRDSALDDLTAFLETFPMRNIAGDEDLAEVVGRLQAIRAGVSVEALRDLDGLREQVRSQVAEAAVQLDGLVQSYRRGISL